MLHALNASPVAFKRSALSATSRKNARQPNIQPPRNSKSVQTTTCGYKFGDFSRNAAKRVKERLDKVGQKVTGDESYQVGDMTRKLVKDLKESSDNYEFGDISRGLVQKISEYKFGDLTESALNTAWGQKFFDGVQEAGRKVTGRDDYKVGDLARGVQDKLAGAKDYAAKVLALPSEVESLKQIAIEQELLINALTETCADEEAMSELKLLEGSAEDFHPLILENQEIIDVLVEKASLDE